MPSKNVQEAIAVAHTEPFSKILYRYDSKSFWISFLTLGLCTKWFADSCANLRGKKTLKSCEPYGPHFWTDITRIEIENNYSMLSRERNASTDSDNPSFFTHACFFHSTKTNKKIANAITDISVLIILILYRK